jgi:heme/copper-type cytochrome/quinol oxidase subunit 3
MQSASAEHAPEATALGIDNRKLGLWLLLGSEAVFFSGLIITFIVFRGKSVSGLTAHEALNVPLTAVNTFVLLCSSLTMVSALAAIEKGSVRGVRGWLLATALLGLTFLGGQAYEFTRLFREGVSLSSNLFGATFFTLTGFHGAHVLAGVVWIGFVLARALTGGVTQHRHEAVELAGLYWHFVDLVWIIIFTIVYLI